MNNSFPEGESKMRMKDVMGHQIIAVDFNRSCGLAAKIMADNKVGSVLIRKGEDIVGIVTETDLVYRVMAEGKDPLKTIVDTVMSFPIYSIDEEATVEEARKIMSENQIRHLIVTRRGKPHGMFSARNLIDGCSG